MKPQSEHPCPAALASFPSAKRVAVLFALLLAACATPSREASAPVPTEAVAPHVAEPAVPAIPPAPVATARTAPPADAIPPAATLPVEPAAPTTPIFREFVAANDERLLEAFPGMHRAELARVMQHGAGRWPNPYRHESLHDRAGKVYEVFYYLTRDPEGKPVKDRHLTPVIVKDNVVVAIGSYRLKKLKRGESLDLPRRASKRAS